MCKRIQRTGESKMKIIQINILANSRSTGRTTMELHNFLLERGEDSYVAYGIGEKTDDPHMFKITNKFGYFLHNTLAKITKREGCFSRFSTRKLVRWMKRIKPDVVHLRNLHESYVNYKILFKYLVEAKCKVVFTTHDFWFVTATCKIPKDDCDMKRCDECHHFKRNIFFNLKRYYEMKKNCFLLLNHLGIQCNSYFSESIIKKSFLANASSCVIYNWIDFSKFYYDYDKSIFGLNDNRPVVLVIWSALNESSYRFKFFIEIANTLHKKYNFVMVGSHSFSHDKYPFIHFLNSTNSVDLLRKYYSSADVFFNPSTMDTFGKVVAESLSCGTPAIVFNNQALPELVHDERYGVIIEPDNKEEAINAIEKVIEKGKGYYIDNCLKRSRELFDMDTNCSALLNFYNKIS